MSAPAERFAYYRAIAPIFWVWLTIASVELIVVHLLVSLWRPGVALVLSVLTLASIGWLIGAARSFRTMPVLIEGDRLVMRAGRIKAITVSLADIAAVTGAVDPAALRLRTTLKLSLLAYPNVIVELAAARSGGRGVRRIAHRLDDPLVFIAALGRRGVATEHTAQLTGLPGDAPLLDGLA